MWRRISSLFARTQNLKQAFGILFITVLLSNILGLLRDVIMTNRVGVAYGSLAPLDKFYAAFVLPDLLYNILIVGALSSAILPMLVRINNEDEEKFWRIYNMLLSTGLVVIVVGVIALLVIMPAAIPKLFPGFSPADQHTTTVLTQIMLLSPLFFTASQISTSALQAKRSFFAPALAPIVYNASIIISALFIPKFGVGSLVVGTVIGAAGHFLIQLPSLVHHGWRFRFKTGFHDAQVRWVGKVMVPQTISLTSTQLLLLAFFQLASSMAHGSIAIYQLADDLQTAPVLLLANTVATALLPDFSHHFASNELTEFRGLVTKTIRLFTFLFLPITSYLIIYRVALMNLFIAIGHSITIAQINAAALTFGWFVSSLFFQGSVLILVRAFFARRETVKPTIFALISLAVAWILAEVLAHFTAMGVAGLALSFSVGSTLNAILLWLNFGLPAKDLIRDSQNRANLKPVLFGTLWAVIIFWLIRFICDHIFASAITRPAAQEFITIIIGFIGGLAVYLAWARMTNLEQWQLLITRNSTKS